MIINRVKITKFRGFSDVEFSLGTAITVIVGQNGTQKTTVLGILTQPFSITDTGNPIFTEKPLCGGNFKSAFSEKFKFSPTHDKPGEHEWTLYLSQNIGSQNIGEFTTESILRKEKGKPDKFRFWKKGDRKKGAGYIQIPVIYLSLSRLLPIGEDEKLAEDDSIQLNEDEQHFYKEWHNTILILHEDITSHQYVSSNQKNTLGANTNNYDWVLNSAGQDNIGKILLAVLSFRRLKQNHKDHYRGGIIAIDELDASLYPGAQIELVKALRYFASKFDIQFIFTTHSLEILQDAIKLSQDSKLKGQVRTVYLQKQAGKIVSQENISFDFLKNHLNVTLGKTEIPKVFVFTEDQEAQIFVKAILKHRTRDLKFIDCSLGWGNLMELAQKKVPGFAFPDSIVILDGDTASGKRNPNKLSKLRNFLILPGNSRPESLIAQFLWKLDDNNSIWGTINQNYTQQVCFKGYASLEALNNRENAKNWFKKQKQYWGRNAAKVINPWITQNQGDIDQFICNFDALIKKVRTKRGFL